MTARISPCVVGEVLADGRIPDRLDLGIGERAVGHDLRGAQLVAAVDEVDLRGEAREEGRLLGRGIAAADHADGHVAVKGAVAGGARGEAVADELLFARQPEPARGGARGDDERARFDPLVIELHAQMARPPARIR